MPGGAASPTVLRWFRTLVFLHFSAINLSMFMRKSILVFYFYTNWYGPASPCTFTSTQVSSCAAAHTFCLLSCAVIQNKKNKVSGDSTPDLWQCAGPGCLKQHFSAWQPL